MTDFAAYQDLEFAFAQLLTGLSKTWPASDIAYIRDIVAHAEYGDALENLVVIGTGNSRGFVAGQMRQVEAIGTKMGVNVPALLETVRAQPLATTAA